MASAISFGGPNYGSEIGINHGSVTNEFHFPLDFNQFLPIVPGAVFNSYADQHKSKCLPGTRTDIINQIREWASSPHGKCMFWLNGLAGTGKSTISRTMAESFSMSKSLGASFFFERGEGDRGNARKLFPTIARQLAINIRQLKPFLQETVLGSPDIAEKAMREQFEKLIVQPLQSLERSDVPFQTMVIVMDALDECEGDSDIRLILQLLPQLQNITAIRVRVLLTSRPDLPIRLGFLKIANDDYKDLVLHDIPMEAIKHDISLFFDHRLTDIRTERLLPTDWPGSRDIQRLVALSVPLFIFAATVCRIFEEPDWDPMDSLTEIFTHQNEQSKLSGTYLPVLNRLLDRQHLKQKEKLVSEFHCVVGAIVTLESPLSVGSLSKLLGLPERLIHLRLNPLHSVLRVPAKETGPVRLFHQSFRDFLLDPETRQKTPFGINKTEMHHRLTRQCLFTCQNLRKNICGLPSDGTRRAEVDQPTIDRCLPQELQYACRYWAHHLIHCTDYHKVIHDDALLFLQRHFLHWVEAMSLLGLISEVLFILNRLRMAIPGNDDSMISQFLHDAKRFLLKNRQIADDAPLQLYSAGLIFAPQTSIIREGFTEALPTWIRQLPRVDERWGALTQTLEGHSSWVESVAFSPDGQLLASGSHDKTVRLWDLATGALQHTLEGHSSWVESVAFSPDGRLLASGSHDKTVRLWDLTTDALYQTLEGHSSSVASVAFSPDSRLLASASDDKTLRLWDTATGVQQQQTLEGHSSRIQSVAFSPDGRLLASGYHKTVRLWDTTTGELTLTLEGHSSWVASITFSPDGRLLASASRDETVRLWDTATGALTQTPFGHSTQVRSVSFSPDSRLLASASHDETVRLWDTAAGALTQTPDGHSGPVQSIVFSPDGRLLASVSDDETVRLWDTATGVQQQILGGHSSWVQSVTFSLDGRLLASASDDGTVRLWDTATGALTLTLDGHSDWALSVAFSPDGRLLASASDDETVRLWDTATGACTLTLEGHSDWVRSVAFSPDGRLLTSASHDGKVRLWNMATGTLTQTLVGHSSSVHSVIFSPNSRLLASASDDETVRLWDTATGTLTQTWNSEESVTTVEFSHDGSHVHTNSGVLEIRSTCDFIPTSHPSHVDLGISIEDKKWVNVNGEKVLWLPVESRPRCYKISDNTLALGHASGRISFIGFCM